MKDSEPAALPLIATGAQDYAPHVVRNVENFVGLARVPIGLAGPLRIRGSHLDDEVIHVPLATTEGTLVASTCRGMKVLNEAGGAMTRVVRVGTIQRAPVFELEDIGAAVSFAQALGDGAWLGEVVSQTTRHGRLVDVKTFVTGRHVHVRISLQPGDAAGQNMVSVAAARCVEAILERHGGGVRRVLLEGGLSGEKVASPLNHLLGRGWSVVASAVIPGEVLRRVTRAEPENIVAMHQLYANAALHAGQINSHASLINILPAIYIATGQDVASVAESCMARNALSYTPGSDELRWEVDCPSLVLATVGGGTHLPTQAEALASMDCHGSGRAGRLAEICAATALANEVSFWAAICAQEWVAAHDRARTR